MACPRVLAAGLTLKACLCRYNACPLPSNFCNTLQPGQQVCIRVASTCSSNNYPCARPLAWPCLLFLCG